MTVCKLENSMHHIPLETLNELKQQAMNAQKKAYCPYSNYPVGAAILTVSGKIYSGCNVENAVYGETICAERVAVTKAVSEGDKKIKAVAIVLGDKGSPCGACRQVINEFGPNAFVFASTSNGEVQNSWTIKGLLPDGFGPENLTY